MACISTPSWVQKIGDFKDQYIMQSYQSMLDFGLYPGGKVVLEALLHIQDMLVREKPFLQLYAERIWVQPLYNWKNPPGWRFLQTI